MATSGRLIERMAEVCRMPTVTVGTYYKALREAGLTSKSGRGPSAARMTVSDVANVLLALISGEYAKDSPDAVRRIRSLKRVPRGSLDCIGGEDFGAFFDQLLRLELDGKMRELLSAIPNDLFLKSPDRVLSEKDVSDLRTGYWIEFNLDRGMIKIETRRRSPGHLSVIEGALFLSETEIDASTWRAGIITSKLLGDAIIRHILDLLNSRRASP